MNESQNNYSDDNCVTEIVNNSLLIELHLDNITGVFQDTFWSQFGSSAFSAISIFVFPHFRNGSRLRNIAPFNGQQGYCDHHVTVSLIGPNSSQFPGCYTQDNLKYFGYISRMKNLIQGISLSYSSFGVSPFSTSSTRNRQHLSFMMIYCFISIRRDLDVFFGHLQLLLIRESADWRVFSEQTYLR